MIKAVIKVFSCLLTGIAEGQSIFKTIEIAWQGYGDIEPAPFKKNEQR